jgi:hypothetical protein
VSVADRHLDGGAILLDQQFARIELHEIELLRYQPASVRAPIAGAIGGTAAGNALKSGRSHQQGGWRRRGGPDFDGRAWWGAAAPDAAGAAAGLDIGGIVKDLVGGAVVMAIIGAL